MKKVLATLLLVGTVAGVSACTSEGEGYRDEAPYARERTAGGEVEREQEVRSERVFRERQTK